MKKNVEHNEKNIHTGITCKKCQMLTELFKIHNLLNQRDGMGQYFVFNFNLF